jgi:hypothetical protein
VHVYKTSATFPKRYVSNHANENSFEIFSKELRRESKRLKRELRESKKTKLDVEVDTKDKKDEEEGWH